MWNAEDSSSEELLIWCSYFLVVPLHVCGRHDLLIHYNYLTTVDGQIDRSAQFHDDHLVDQHAIVHDDNKS